MIPDEGSPSGRGTAWPDALLSYQTPAGPRSVRALGYDTRPQDGRSPVSGAEAQGGCFMGGGVGEWGGSAKRSTARKGSEQGASEKWVVGIAHRPEPEA